MLAGQDGVDALFHQALASPSNCVNAGLQGGRYLAVTPRFAYPSAEGRGAGGAGSSNQLLESRTIWRRHSIPNGVKAVMA